MQNHYRCERSGMHCNLSLFKNGGETYFLMQTVWLQLSDDARHFIAGILKHGTSIYSDSKPNC